MISKTISHLEASSKMVDALKFVELMSAYDTENNIEEFKKAVIKRATLSAQGKVGEQLRSQIKDLDSYAEQKAKCGLEDYEYVSAFFVCYTIFRWTEYKQIYKIDEDAKKMIFDSKLNDMTYDAFSALKLPYEVFALECDFESEDDNIDSVLLYRKTDKDGGIHLEICGFSNDTTYTLALVVVEPNETLYDALEKQQTKAKKDLLEKVIKLCLYICQPKVEVLKKAVIKDKKEKLDKLPKHFYKMNYEENSVGVRLGNAIRKYKIIYQESQTEHKKTGTKKPHTRCGHFHHYWTGKGRTNLIVKYLEPTFVLGGNDKATLHNVKK